ncbi:hypothetical protein CK220_11075 [Mesorhizobium sp. WSM3860]|nr:hypothetical protein CK220_11075 [Mesorhizobium sp. WSM3860]
MSMSAAPLPGGRSAARRSSAVLHHELGQVKDGVARRIIVTINEQIHSGVRESEDRPDSQPSGRAYPL